MRGAMVALGMLDISVLTTSRLRLRPLALDDAAAMAALLGDDHEAIQQTSHVPDPCTVEGARGWIELRSGPCSFAIEVGDELIGTIGAGLDDDGTEAGIGYWLGRPHWGRGYATEAMRALLAYLGSLGVRRVEADTYVGNAASSRVLEKAGFVYRDTVDEVQPVRGGVRRIERYRWTAP